MRDYDDNCPYLQFMEAEHHRVNDMLYRATRMFPNWEEVNVGSWLPRIVQQWRAIRAELDRHFKAEEEGGCLEEAVARRPAIANEVDAIIAEHRDLLAKLDALIARAESLDQPSANAARVLEEQFLDFVKRIRVHEAREDQALQRGLNICTNGAAFLA
jgi:hypothetical protein